MLATQTCLRDEKITTVGKETHQALSFSSEQRVFRQTAAREFITH